MRIAGEAISVTKTLSGQHVMPASHKLLLQHCALPTSPNVYSDACVVCQALTYFFYSNM